MNNLVLLNTYHSPIEANIIKNKLESEGIDAYIFDEHSIGVNPLVSSALGGVKVMVRSSDFDIAKEILLELHNTPYSDEEDNQLVCSKCSSNKVQVFSSLKKKKGLASLILSILFFSYPPYIEYVYKCDDCGEEFSKK